MQKILIHIKKNNCLFLFQIGRLFNEEEKKSNEEKLSNCSKETNAYSDITIEEKKSSHLSFIYSIIKNIVLIADIDLLEKLMNENLSSVIFGALEYDIESPKRITHRQYLSEVANFNNILSIKDEGILKKIQMNYLLMYLRDNILARFLDRTGVIVINRLIQMNNIDIIQFLICYKGYLEQAAIHLISNDFKIQYKAVLFIYELVFCSKDLFIRLNYFQELLCQCGFIKAIEYYLMKRLLALSKSIGIRTDILQDMVYDKIIEVLSILISNMPFIFKDYITNKANCDNEGRSLLLMTLSSLIMLSETDFGIKSEIGHMVSRLTDAFMSQSDIELKDIIFTDCMNNLAEFLLVDVYHQDKGNNNRRKINQSKEVIIDILTYSLSNANSCMHYWFIDNDTISKVLFVLRDKDKSLTLSVIKFIRAMIESKNEHYHRAVILSGCLDSIISLFNSSKSKGNMLFSSLMALFDYIIRDDYRYHFIPSIYEHLHSTIYSESNQKYFKPLIEKYESTPYSVGPTFTLIEINSRKTYNDTYPSRNEIEFDGEEYTFWNNNSLIKQSNDFLSLTNSLGITEPIEQGITIDDSAFLGKKRHINLSY